MIDDDIPTVMDRRIAHANKVVKLHNGYATPTTIVFYGNRKEPNINIFQKHRELFDELKKIDANVTFKDNKDNTYNNAAELPTGTAYAEAFQIDDSDKRNGNIYIKCDLTSKYNLYDIKHGPMNIMEFLKDRKIFLKFRKFQTTREATIGFIHSVHPIATLRSELRDDIDNWMKSIDLKPEEYDELASEMTAPEMQEGRSEIKAVVFPTYDIAVNNFGYGNGTERINTQAFEIRCAPDHAITLKKISPVCH